MKEKRKDFPLLQEKVHGHPLIYFDSAATTHKPRSVIDTIKQFYEKEYATVHRAVYTLSTHATHLMQQARIKVQKLLNAKKIEEIIFTKGTTDAINLVASSFGKAFLKPGDEILIGESEHHANIVPWQIACQERGAKLRVIPINDRGELCLESLPELLSERTRLVAISHISNSLGTLNPIKEIIDQAHAAGAKVLIDGAQSAPHIPIDLQALDADFFAFSAHKFYGPTGIGILYGKEALLEKMPPYQGGGDMIKSVTFPKTTYYDLPLKFEAGTPMIAQIIGLGAAIDYINSIGLKEIAAYEQTLFNHATTQLKQIPGLKIIGTAEEKGPIISFVIDDTHPLDIGTMLDFKGIAVRTGHLCAQPTMKCFGITEAVRTSFAFYNTLEEIDQFKEALEALLPNVMQAST